MNYLLSNTNNLDDVSPLKEEDQIGDSDSKLRANAVVNRPTLYQKQTTEFGLSPAYTPLKQPGSMSYPSNSKANVGFGSESGSLRK